MRTAPAGASDGRTTARYVELGGEPHWMSPAAWSRARAEAERWFDRF
jgi:hypothetical protein